MSGKKIKGLNTHPDFRRRCTPASPPMQESQRRLSELLTPSLFAPLRLRDTSVERRDRIVRLPVMTAIVGSIVFRQMPSLAEARRVLACEGLVWVPSVSVSGQALSQRLDSVPAAVFAQLFAEVIEHLHRVHQHSPPKAQIGPEDYSEVQARFGVVFIADGSTLEALRRRLETLRRRLETLRRRLETLRHFQGGARSLPRALLSRCDH